jgi:hypothetical protein
MRDVRMAIRKSKSSGDTVLARIGEGGLGIPAKTVMKSDGAAVSGGLYVPTVGQQPVICRIFSAGCTKRSVPAGLPLLGTNNYAWLVARNEGKWE